MESKTDMKLAMVILSTIVFIRPTRPYFHTTLKELMFHYLLVTLVFTFVSLMNTTWMKTIYVFSNFTTD
jgi:hypothetical protein